jgi:hypothetical protein
MRRALVASLLAGALTVQFGPTTTGRAVDQINAGSMRGVPVPPVPVAPRPDRIWVPDRYVSTPGRPNGVHVPGHWVVVTPEGQVIAPPLRGTVPGTGALEPLPRESP